MKHLWHLQALLLLQPSKGSNCSASTEHKINIFLISVPVPAEFPGFWLFEGDLYHPSAQGLKQETLKLHLSFFQAGFKPQTEQNCLKQAENPHFMDGPLRAAGISPISLHGTWLVVQVQPKLLGPWRREFSSPTMFPALENAEFVPENNRFREVSALGDSRTAQGVFSTSLGVTAEPDQMDQKHFQMKSLVSKLWISDLF